jgi:hypothetical protein
MIRVNPLDLLQGKGTACGDLIKENRKISNLSLVYSLQPH